MVLFFLLILQNTAQVALNALQAHVVATTAAAPPDPHPRFPACQKVTEDLAI